MSGKVYGRWLHRAKWAFLRRFHDAALIRPMIRFVQNLGRKDLVGVEVGVAEGYNARIILKHLPLKKLYLVDPYKEEPKAYSEAWENLKRFMVHEFVMYPSERAATTVPNDLDFVYIDGNHEYEYVKQDVELWYPKVRIGGVIGGHDFNICFTGVCRAVTEFAAKNNLKLQGNLDDWFIVKEKEI